MRPALARSVMRSPGTVAPRESPAAEEAVQVSPFSSKVAAQSRGSELKASRQQQQSREKSAEEDIFAVVLQLTEVGGKHAGSWRGSGNCAEVRVLPAAV